MPNNDGSLSDAEVFGAPPPQAELTDAQVFGMPNAQPERSMAGNIAHYAGVGLGGVDRGIAAIADMGPEVWNAGATAITNEANNPYNLPLPATMLANKFVEKDGKPESALQQKAQDITAQGVAGSIGGPTAMIGSIASGQAGQWVGEHGGTPREQMMASLLAGTGATAATGTARMAFGPSTPMGKNALMAKYLVKNTQNPEQAVSNLENVPEYVPNSPATAGPASEDYGLMGLERGVRGIQNSNFGEVGANQNAARMAYLNTIAGTPQELEGMIQKRAMDAAPLYDAAAQEPVNAQSIAPVLSKIDNQIESVGDSSQAGKTLAALRDQINDGLQAKTQNPLIQTYKETRDNLMNKGEREGAYGATVRGVISPTNQEFGQALEGASPSYAQAQQVYRDQSIPINQQQALQELRGQISNSQTDLSTQTRLLSQAKLARVLDNSGEDLKNTLTPEQNAVLENIEKDANRSNAVNSALVRPAGSDTAANTLVASTIGKLAHKGSFGILDDSSVNPQKIAAILQDPAKTRAMLLKGMSSQSLLSRIGKNYAAMLLGQDASQNQGSQ